MNPAKQSHGFNIYIAVWKILGMWADKKSSKYYMTYSYVFVTITSVFYFMLFTLNLMFAPRTVELFVTEALFYVAELSGISKLLMIFTKREKIISAINRINCEEFQAKEPETIQISKNQKSKDKLYAITYTIICQSGAHVFLIIIPIINFLITNAELKFPICNYYFLTDTQRNEYFAYIFIYQTICMTVTVTCNVTIHTFVYILLSIATTQFKMLNWRVENIKLHSIEKNCAKKEKLYLDIINQCLKQHLLVLR